MKKKLLHLALRIYPRAWRERYRAEFEALLEDMRPRFADVVDVVCGGIIMRLRSKNIASTTLLFALAGGLAALALSYSMPKTFRSDVTLTIQAVDTAHFGPDQLAALTRAFFKPEYLEQLIREYDLYPTDRAHDSSETVLHRTREAIRITSLGANRFQMSFAYSDPSVARRVTTALANRFVEENMRLAEETRRPLARVSLENVPTLPRFPVAPNRRLITTYGVALGLTLGIVAAWVIKRTRAIVSG